MHPAADHEPRQPGRLGSQGYILLETAAAYIIAAYVIVSLLSVLSLAVKSGPATQRTLVATGLASELLDEVKTRKWDEGEAAYRPAYPSFSRSAIGTDAGESASSKTTFDDIDDFNGWTETAPKDPLGNTLDGLSEFSRSVTVGYVTSAHAASGPATDYKKVTVCAQKTGAAGAQVCLDWVATRI